MSKEESQKKAPTPWTLLDLVNERTQTPSFDCPSTEALSVAFQGYPNALSEIENLYQLRAELQAAEAQLRATEDLLPDNFNSLTPADVNQTITPSIEYVLIRHTLYHLNDALQGILRPQVQPGQENSPEHAGSQAFAVDETCLVDERVQNRWIAAAEVDRTNRSSKPDKPLCTQRLKWYDWALSVSSDYGYSDQYHHDSLDLTARSVQAVLNLAETGTKELQAKHILGSAALAILWCKNRCPKYRRELIT